MPDEPQLHAPRRFALIRAPRDFAAGASLVALALFALWAGGPLPVGTLRSVRPGMLPRAVAVLVLACGIALLALSLARRGAGFDRWSLRGPLFVSLGVVAFALTIRTAGLAVAGPLVVVVSGAASPEARPRELVAYAIVMTALCIGLFRYALHLPIPVLVVPGVLVV